MARSAILSIKILTDATNATKGMDKAATGVDKFSAKMERAAVPAAAVGLGVLAFGKAAITAASDTQQAMGAVESVFGSSAAQIKKWSDTSAATVGLASSDYASMASVIGAQLKNMGVPMDQVAGKTNDLITMGADLAATYGGTTADAVNALGSALRGETDPIERYGISIKQADIAARQAKDGTKGLEGEAGKAAKTQALLALATEQAGGAMGQFAREQDSAAGSAQIATAQWTDAKAALGTALLPTVSALAGALGSMSAVVQDNATAFQILLAVIGGVAAVVLAINAAMKVHAAVQVVVGAALKLQTSTLGTWLGVKGLELAAWVRTAAATVASTAATVANTVVTKAAAAASKAWAAAQWLLNAAMSANPVGLLIAAVLLLVAGFVLLYRRSETFRRVVLAVWSAVKAGAVAAANVVKRIWQVVFAAASAYVRAYAAVFRAVFNVVRSVATAVANVVKAIWRVVWAAVGAYVRAYAAVFRAVFNGIRATASAIANAVKAVWSGVFSALRSAASGMASVLSGPFHLVESAVNAVVGAVRNLIGWLGRIHVPKISLPHIPGFNAATTAAPVAAGARTTRAPRAAPAAPVTVNIYGAVDPESTARQVRRVLSAHDRRMGLSGAGLRTGLV